MLKSKFGKLLAVNVIIGANVLGYSAQHQETRAVEANYYYDGIQGGSYQAYLKAKKISNNSISIQRYPNTSRNNLEAIDRVSNLNGWEKGSRNASVRKQDSIGTETVIGAHTFVISTHVIDDRYGRAAAPKYIKFQMNRDGNRMPYAFQAAEMIKVPQYGIAVVHTKRNISKYVKPAKIATDSEIKQLKFNSPLYSLGYPWQCNDNTKAYFSKLRVTQFSTNGTEIQTKDVFRSDASGSPMLNSAFTKVYGLRTYGYNLVGGSTDAYAKQEMSGGESLKGYAGRFVRRHIK